MAKQEREPIFWTSTAQDFNRDDRERAVFVDGKRVIEKIPQIGHKGGEAGYDDKERANLQRYILVVRNEGHVVPLLLTNAAAHADANSPYAVYQKNKARALGWYPAGACPCLLISSGEYYADQFRANEARTGKPCDPESHSQKKPCKHDMAEREARRKAWNADETERMAKFKPAADRHLEEQGKQHNELLGVIRDLIANGGVHSEPVKK